MSEQSFLQRAREQHDAIGRFAAATNSIEFKTAVENLVPVLRRVIEEGRRSGLQDGAMHLLSKVAIAAFNEGKDPALQKATLELMTQKIWTLLTVQMPENREILERALPIMQEAIHERLAFTGPASDAQAPAPTVGS